MGKLWCKNWWQTLTFLNTIKSKLILLIGYNIIHMPKRNLKREYGNIKIIDVLLINTFNLFFKLMF